ncbi:MAG: BTAD domain-containing putative transcriptional regulator [Gaiellaceae bacterium]
MEFSILGPLEAVAEGGAVSLGAAKPRALLAILLLHVNEPVSSDRLIEDLWANQPPATAAKVLQAYISQLRRALGRDTIATRPAGYELCVETGGLDVHRFERLVTEARGAAPPDAARQLRQALALWRGPALVEFAYEPWAQGEIGRLEKLHLSALQDRIDADLALGSHGELVGELERLVAEHPLAERLRGQLMLALYRSGRQAEALDAYRSARATLVEQLAIEPGSALRHLERAILDQDPELDAASVAPDARPVPRLRARSTSFVGRGREQREIRALLSRADLRLLTLTGPAGTGKTRLAVEATIGLDAEFPGGVVLVELAPIGDADLVATTIAGALGLTERPGRGSLDALVASLRGRRALLVLDNFEQVLEAAPMLTELLAGAPGVTLLVTSRAPLDVLDERIYPVPALQLPDSSRPLDVGRLRRTEAVRLFVDRARHARADFELSELNVDAVAELCLRLDGLPLALELAAARIKLLAPRDIVERLGAKLEVLKAEPGAGLPKRHQTLRAAIEWSYDLLGAEEQALFTSLGVFVGGFTLDGARAAAGDLELDVVTGVESLLNHSLLRTEPMAGGEPRFGLLETIREYALERLAERGDGPAVRRRHAGFYLPLAEEAEPALLGPQQLRWLRRLDAELDNLRAALTWATEEDEADVGLRIGAALWRYWQLRGSDSEGRERLERLLALRSGSGEARAQALSRTASLAFVKGDHEAVRRYGDASLPVLRRLGDNVVLAGTLGLMGNSALSLGDLDRARALTEEAVEVGRRSGDPMTESYTCYTAGVVFAWRGELDEAERLIEESVRLARQVGNVRSVASWSRSLGGIALARGDHSRARLLFEESLALHRMLGDTWGISHTLTRLAFVMLAAQDTQASRRPVAESVALELKSGDRPGLVFNFEVCAGLAAAEGRRRRAVRLHACASALRGSVGDHPSEVGWPNHARHVDDLRSELGEKAFAEAWAQGGAMSFDESLDYALAEEAV